MKSAFKIKILWLFLIPLLIPATILMLERSRTKEEACSNHINGYIGMYRSYPSFGSNDAIARLSYEIKRCPNAQTYTISRTTRYFGPDGPARWRWFNFNTKIAYDRAKRELKENSSGNCGAADCSYEAWGKINDTVIHNAAAKNGSVRNLAKYGGLDKHP